MSVPALLGRATHAATTVAHHRFLRSLAKPEDAQNKVLRRVIRDCAPSAYGSHHGLESGDGRDAFQDKIPVTDYEELRPWIERAVSGGEASVLSAHPVVRVEATSGSHSEEKLIPYTRPMLATFGRMFTLWAHDLLRSGLYRPRSGKLFMCVTGGGRRDGRGGDDREFLGRGWRALLDRFVQVPRFGFEENDDPLDALARSMAAEPRLEVFSFWSPSLLLSALDQLGISTPEEARDAWPDLQLISCWAAASSACFLEPLHRIFPWVTVQGKGLLATEAAVTFPSVAAGGCAPLLGDVYLEFLDSAGKILALHELEDSGEYEVLVSTRAGLLRYRLGDRVRVDGFCQCTPLLDFIGRAGIVSDLVGEKLTLEFVSREIGPLVDGYFCLLPLERGYALWLDSCCRPRDAIEFEECLCQNVQYARALRLGQLAPLRVHRAERLADRIRESATRAGDAGDFKPPLLISDRNRAREISRELSHTATANKA